MDEKEIDNAAKAITPEVVDPVEVQQKLCPNSCVDGWVLISREVWPHMQVTTDGKQERLEGRLEKWSPCPIHPPGMKEIKS